MLKPMQGEKHKKTGRRTTTKTVFLKRNKEHEMIPLRNTDRNTQCQQDIVSLASEARDPQKATGNKRAMYPHQCL